MERMGKGKKTERGGGAKERKRGKKERRKSNEGRNAGRRQIVQIRNERKGEKEEKVKNEE
ncbi:hypothetical protein FJN16_13560 [Tannerella forsythia]|uniref:hypothetical protein n=1 Tax=Tannerella forsythia TaxID=28112 RepID=UPI0011213969|nr:hypothetical protein [Tannerella forsythia]TPE12188.1 hypothetical protein FJN16_13560 [Tannerella forsythia]